MSHPTPAPSAAAPSGPSAPLDARDALEHARASARRRVYRALDRVPVDGAVGYELAARVARARRVDGTVDLAQSAAVLRLARTELDVALDTPTPCWRDVKRWHQMWCAARAYHDALSALAAATERQHTPDEALAAPGGA